MSSKTLIKKRFFCRILRHYCICIELNNIQCYDFNTICIFNNTVYLLLSLQPVRQIAFPVAYHLKLKMAKKINVSWQKNTLLSFFELKCQNKHYFHINSDYNLWRFDLCQELFLRKSDFFVKKQDIFAKFLNMCCLCIIL